MEYNRKFECSQKFICEGRIVKISALAEIVKTLGRNIGYPQLNSICCDYMDECHKRSKDCEIIQNFKENAIKNLTNSEAIFID